jgi:putative ABC transport system ATP-binding protein
MGKHQTADKEWGCHLTDIVIDRSADDGAGFNLNIPSLSLTSKRDADLNRIPIMGVSGAGKSTLMNIMAAIEWPHSSRSRIEWTFPDGNCFSWGQDGPNPPQLSELRSRYFGYAFQSSTLIPHLNIGQNLTYPLEIRGVKKSGAVEKMREVIEDISMASIGNLVDRFPGELSGGELQRIALMQSMIYDPAVMFADEPTGSLDLKTRRTVMKVLTDWVDREPEGRMLIWVTHHENDPQDNGCEYRLIVADGGCCRQRISEDAV